jgi:hypothetical protein
MKTCRITRSYLVALWAVLFVSCGPAVAQSVAVFDFELIDTSLEGASRGARPDEQERLARLSDQLRQRLRDSGRFSLVDFTPIASEAQASNLQACGGCDKASLRSAAPVWSLSEVKLTSGDAAAALVQRT